MALFDKADQAYIIRKNGASMLCKLKKTELKDTVHFLCSTEKKVGDTYSKHSRSNKKTREQIAKVNPVWTKYFDLLAEEEKEPTVNSDE